MTALAPHLDREVLATSGNDGKDAGIKGLRGELVRVTEEGDILKKAAAYFAKDAKRDARSLPRIAR